MPTFCSERGKLCHRKYFKIDAKAMKKVKKGDEGIPIMPPSVLNLSALKMYRFR